MAISLRESFEGFVGAVHALVWGPPMLTLLLGTGLFLSLRCGFPQLLRFGTIVRRTAGSLFQRRKKTWDPNFSPFQALSTALGGTVGTGNIAGVTGAILWGGPGAVFWMWAAALPGMCTKYVEILLAVKYRASDEKGLYCGGAMYCIERGLGPRMRWLAGAFALLGGLAAFGIGNLTQSSEIAASLQGLVGLPPSASGVLVALFAAAVLFGGRRRIGRVAALLVPLMSVCYVLAALAVILPRLSELPGVFRQIFRGAFGFRAAGGAFFGCELRRAVRMGVSRGVFSNEAGLGSSPMAHAASSCGEPCEQAMWGVLEVFLDTFVICTLTALVVLLAGRDVLAGAPSAGAAAAAAFDAVLPGLPGGTVIRVCLLFFALSTILGWGCYGELCWSYLFRGPETARLVFRLLFPLACLIGSLGTGRLVWDIADTLNALMALPNLTALLLLSGEAARLSKAFFTQAETKLPCR